VKKQIAIIGAGGLGREVLTLVNALPEWDFLGFYDDNIPKGSIIKNKPILGTIADLHSTNQNQSIVIAIGDVEAKHQVIKRLYSNNHLHFPTLIHPHALLQDPSSISIGSGSVIAAGTILTADIQIGPHVLVNLSCTIGHGTTIDEGCSIMPGVNIAGNVRVGKHVLIGSGANVLANIKIGDRARVGAGAVVTKPVEPSITVVGIPARELKSTL
jgi:sugar O-acyltransferase (sialic acid O-acetyltransferase NeuD family)